MKLMFSLLVLLAPSLALANDPTVALKAEIQRLKTLNSELEIKVGDLQMENEDLKYKLSTEPTVVTETKVKRVGVYKRHRVSVLSGVSHQGPDKHITGLQYQTLLNTFLSVGGQVQSNDTVLLNFGLEF